MYHCEPPNNKGYFNFPPSSTPEVMPSEYASMVKVVTAKGWPLMIHANGDKAISFALQAYENVLDGEKGLVKRHCIE